MPWIGGKNLGDPEERSGRGNVAWLERGLGRGAG